MKMLVSQTTDIVDLYSPGIDAHLFGMDGAQFRLKRDYLAVWYHGGRTEYLLGLCVMTSMAILTFSEHQDMIDDDMITMLEIMNLLLLQSNANSSIVRFICIDMLM